MNDHLVSVFESTDRTSPDVDGHARSTDPERFSATKLQSWNAVHVILGKRAVSRATSAYMGCGKKKRRTTSPSVWDPTMKEPWVLDTHGSFIFIFASFLPTE